MNNKKRTAGIAVLFSFLFSSAFVSYGQPGSVRDTTVEFLYQPLSSDSTGGSVRDTTSYVALIATSKTPKGGKSQVVFYRFYCKICCFLWVFYSGHPALPQSDKVVDPKIYQRLKYALLKQLDHAGKVVHSIR